jgi:hypothetical protein
MRQTEKKLNLRQAAQVCHNAQLARMVHKHGCRVAMIAAVDDNHL